MGQSNYNWSFGDGKAFKKNPEIDNFAPDRQYKSVQGIKPTCSDIVMQHRIRRISQEREERCARPHIFDVDAGIE